MILSLNYYQNGLYCNHKKDIESEENNMSVLTITKENFQSEVIESSKPVLLDFWASWCGPCRMMSPVVDQVAEEREDIKVGKVNVDEQPELASQFQVMTIPTFLVFSEGEVVNKAIGVMSKQKVLDLLV